MKYQLFIETIIDFFGITIVGGVVLHFLTTMIDNHLHKSEEKINDEISLQHPPIFIGKLVGRKTDVKRLRKKLQKSNSVWISSIGGIGKSTLAIIYAHKYKSKYKRIYWLSWKGTLKNTLKDKINIQASSNLLADEIYNKILYYFREQVAESSLLIIDGLDNYVVDEIDIINTFKCKLLITSRRSSCNHNEYPLDMLSEAECSRLFRLHAKAKLSSKQLDTILELTGRHTLSIKLFARYARCYSVEKLFSDIVDHDINSLHNKIEIIDGEPNNQIIAHYMRIYSIICNQEEKLLLMNLSFLPSIDLRIKDLQELFGHNVVEKIVELEKLGWIIRRGNRTIYLHPVLSNTIRQISLNEQTSPKTYQEMITNVNDITSSSIDGFDSYDKMIRFLPYCESIKNYYHWEDPLIAQMLINISHIVYIVSGNNQAVLKDAEKACEILKIEATHHEKFSQQYARALTDISEYYYKESGRKAIEIEEKALDIKKNLSTPYRTLDILKSYSNLMLYHHSNFDNDYLMIAEHIIIKYQDEIKTFKRTAANLYNHFALLLRSQNRRKESICYLKKAENILTINNAKSHYMYPLIINTIGGVYGELYKSTECLDDNEKKDALKNALKYLYKSYYIKKRQYGKITSSIAISLHNIATTWSYMHCHFIAMFYEYKAIKIREQYSSEQLLLASSFLRLGTIFKDLYKKYHISYFKLKGIALLEKAVEIYQCHNNEEDDIDCKNELNYCRECLDSLNMHK